MLDAALARMSQKHDDPERRRTFVALRPLLTGHDPDLYGTTAAQLGMTEGAVRVAVHRLRKQFAACVRAVIGETVEGLDEVDRELHHLLAVLSR